MKDGRQAGNFLVTVLLMTLVTGTPVLGQTTAAHSSAGYTSPGTCTVTCRFTREENKTLSGLLYYILPPDGWTVTGVSGDGSPEYGPADKAILLFGSLASLQVRPLTITYTMSVPPGETGPRNLAATVQYTYGFTSAPVAVRATPDPLVVVRSTNSVVVSPGAPLTPP
jgi:hypothetical protein